MSKDNPKQKGKNQSLNNEKKLVNDKFLERNVQYEISKEFLNKNKKNLKKLD